MNLKNNLALKIAMPGIVLMTIFVGGMLEEYTIWESA